MMIWSLTMKWKSPSQRRQPSMLPHSRLRSKHTQERSILPQDSEDSLYSLLGNSRLIRHRPHFRDNSPRHPDLRLALSHKSNHWRNSCLVCLLRCTQMILSDIQNLSCQIDHVPRILEAQDCCASKWHAVSAAPSSPK